MLVYYVVILTITVISSIAMYKQTHYINRVRPSNNRISYGKGYIFAIFCVFGFVATFRYNVGADFTAYYRYEDIVRIANRLFINPFDEPGAAFIAWINQKFFPNVDGFFVMVAAVITMALFVYTIGKNSYNLLLSCLLFIFIGAFTGSFNGVRQYMATAILFTGYHHVINRDLKKWILVVLCASCFHVTAILMFFIYFLCTQKTSFKLVLFYVAIAIFLLYTYDGIFELLGTLKNETITLTDYTTRSVNRVRVIVQCVPLVIPVLLGLNKINEDIETRFFVNVSLFNAAVSIAAMNSAYFSRFNIYTSIFLVLMYPCVLKKMRRNNRIILTALMLIFYFVYWHYETSKSWDMNNFQWIFSVWSNKNLY